MVLAKFSTAAAAQRVSETLWKEARLGLVKHHPLAECFPFPLPHLERLPSLHLCGLEACCCPLLYQHSMLQI